MARDEESPACGGRGGCAHKNLWIDEIAWAGLNALSRRAKVLSGTPLAMHGSFRLGPLLELQSYHQPVGKGITRVDQGQSQACSAVRFSLGFLTANLPHDSLLLAPPGLPAHRHPFRQKDPKDRISQICQGERPGRNPGLGHLATHQHKQRQGQHQTPRRLRSSKEESRNGCITPSHWQRAQIRMAVQPTDEPVWYHRQPTGARAGSQQQVADDHPDAKHPKENSDADQSFQWA